MDYFRGSLLVTLVGVLAAAWFGGWPGALTAILLGALEVSLSFDNAVVNAKVLEGMSEIWRKRFLTWGMLIAVFGMRFAFPIVIVAVLAHMGFLQVLDMALHNPAEYARKLMEAHVAISSFGGAFLLMVFARWIADPDKDVHWLPLEKVPHGWDEIPFLVLGVVLTIVVGTTYNISETAMVCGVWGVVLYQVIQLLGSIFEQEGAAGLAAKGGAMSFIYLEVLDASFSFDGVIGAFAVTNNVLIIMAGLAIGAMFVRSLTIMLVEKGTLAEYRYLEHGAHWGIGSLAALMFVSLFTPVPELVSGLVGVAFIVTAFGSSLKPIGD